MLFKYRKIVSLLLLCILFINFAMAQDPSRNLRNAFGAICDTAKGLLALVAIVLIVLAAIVYGLGQVLGAETRARATVWATAMFTGAIIGGLIWIIMPWIISILMSGEADGEWVSRCCVKNPPDNCAGFETGGSSSEEEYYD